MQGFCQRLGWGVGRHQAGRTAAGWFSLALAVTVTQATVVSPAFAQHKPPTTAAVTDTALAWGENDEGQLGNGGTTNTSEPTAVSLPSGTLVTAIAGGDGHSLALTSTGSVLAWGDNSDGQLGDGTTTDTTTPVAVDLPTGTEVTAIAAGAVHSLSLSSTGGAFAWGNNDQGQLGDETTLSTSTPVNVALQPGTTLLAVAGGSGHSLAITSDNAAIAWGDNSQGQLGDGTTTDALAPVNVALAPGTEITAVAAGRLHSVALTSAGTAFTWGNNASGQLGNGTNTTSSTPVAVSLPTGTTLTAIAAHNSNHTVAITNTETALAWGDNSFGQLGAEITITSSSNTPIPVNLAAGTTVTTTAVGNNHSLALPTLQPSSTTNLNVSPPEPTADQDVTLTATVTCNIDTPTGTITFRNNNTDLATVPLDSNNTATHTTRLPPGTHTLTAHYTSTNTCPSGQSESTTITITAPDNPNTPDDPDLPITGPNLPTILGTATLLILAGATFLFLTRRNRTTHQK
ncbi:cell wall anchor protein [Salinispora arenicola]|uniref:RCC1 domain-containing protein n=1 Tax=Salinispora arenicola TaxID=168697 RepID=UPI00142F6CC8|nr:Ig-like domain repeat protein [Salinispora arenicola]NIL42561.1 cell wall anchor protein [Salinispora arenicola]